MFCFPIHYATRMTDFKGLKFICDNQLKHSYLMETWDDKLTNDESLIEIRQVGLCSSDFDRLYNGTSKVYPITPGHEIIGKIKATKDFMNYSVGQLVCVYPLKPCQKCPSCLRQQYHLCECYSYYGSRESGGLANYLKVDNWNILTLDDNLSFEYTHLIEPLSVVIHALKKFEEINESLIITGSGFLSYLAWHYAKHLGISRIRLASENTEFTSLFEYIEENDSAYEFTNLLDLSGNHKTLDEEIARIRVGGEIVTVANKRIDTFISSASRDIILRKELKYTGSWNSVFKGFHSDWNDSINYIRGMKNFTFPVQSIKFEKLLDFLSNNNRESVIGKRFYVTM